MSSATNYLKKTFSPAFIFGVADSDLQVINESETLLHEGSQPSMWAEFARKEGATHRNESPLNGPNRFSKWKEDVELISALSVSAYRTSISMCRILNQDLTVNKKAVTWYRNYFSAIRKKGISIDATLYHWELPQHLSSQGGWTNPATIEAFLAHALAVENELGDLIDSYFVMNEPWCAGWLGYAEGHHAPGEKSVQRSLLAIHHLLLAQGIVTRALHQKNPARNLRTAYNVSTAYAVSNSAPDLLARKYADGIINRWFLDPLFLGSYPEDMLALFEKHLPAIGKSDLQEMQVGSLLSSLGINYYSSGVFTWNDNSPCHYQYTNPPGSRETDLGWKIFAPPALPSGLYDMLCYLYHRYSTAGLQALCVTENGAAYAPVSATTINEDAQRIDYLKEHLSQVHDAITAGIPVLSYYVWTLLDNFEWAYGFQPESNFGLVHVDMATAKRTAKDSFYWYSELVRSRVLNLS